MTWSPFFQTLLGGILALMGAFIGPHLQRKHDKWMAAREDKHLLRDKAEELFRLLDALVSHSRAASGAAIRKLLANDTETMPVPDLEHIRASCTIYFPALLPTVDTFEKDAKELMDKTANQVGELVKGKSVDALKAMPMIAATTYQTLVEKFAKDLRAEIRKISPSFSVE